MIPVPAMRVRQFGVDFYQAVLTGTDVQKLVRFEVLSYDAGVVDAGAAQPKGKKRKATINWELLEKRIARSAEAYQRPVIRKKIVELIEYYNQCAEAGNLPAIPGAVLLVAEKRLDFNPLGGNRSLGILHVPTEQGMLRALDGQHRLLALHQLAETRPVADVQVPAVIFDRLAPDQAVEMFVTINAKHTRLNASHLVSLSGRQLYRDDSLAIAHDIVRALNDRDDSPLVGEIKLLGVGTGRVAQAPLAQELKKLFAADAFGSKNKTAFYEDMKKFFVNYFKQIALVFGGAWNGRKYSIKSATALRTFIRVAPDVVRRLDQEHAERGDFRAIGRVISPWGRRIGDLRFETEGQWKRSGTTVESLAKELRLALQYPEGAAM